MRRDDPIRAVYVVSMPKQAIQMYDLDTPGMRCSYVVEDVVGRVEGALCVRFSEDGARLLAGVCGQLVLFDVQRPGRTPLVRFGPLKRRCMWSALAYTAAPVCVVATSHARRLHVFDVDARPVSDVSLDDVCTALATCGPYVLASLRGRHGHVVCYDLRRLHTPVWTYPRFHSTPQKTSVHVHNHHVVMAACAQNGHQAHRTDLATGTLQQTYLADTHTLTCCTPRDAWMATCSGQRTTHTSDTPTSSFRLWNLPGTYREKSPCT